jgi:hypothetical protein
MEMKVPRPAQLLTSFHLPTRPTLRSAIPFLTKQVSIIGSNYPKVGYSRLGSLIHADIWCAAIMRLKV